VYCCVLQCVAACCSELHRADSNCCSILVYVFVSVLVSVFVDACRKSGGAQYRPPFPSILQILLFICVFVHVYVLVYVLELVYVLLCIFVFAYGNSGST